MIAPALETPSASQPKIPCRVEVDSEGKEWTIPPQGGRLKRTNDHGAHRPKKEVREKWLRLADSESIAWARRILANKNIPDSAPEKLKAIELSLAYGLGKQDEKIELKSAEVIQAYTRRLLERGMTPSEVESLAREVGAELGLPS